MTLDLGRADRIVFGPVSSLQQVTDRTRLLLI